MSQALSHGSVIEDSLSRMAPRGSDSTNLQLVDDVLWRYPLAHLADVAPVRRAHRHRFVLGPRPACLLALCLLVSDWAAMGAENWPAAFDPFQVRTLHLDLEPADWATVRNDTNLSIEVLAWFWEEGQTNRSSPKGFYRTS